MIRLRPHVQGVISAKANNRTYRALQVGKENAEHHRYEEERHDLIEVLIEIYAGCQLSAPVLLSYLRRTYRITGSSEEKRAFFTGFHVAPAGWVV